jgi:hypothetical protein
MSDLVIKGVPDDKAVITEILANAETTIKNYHSKQIRVVAPEKEAEYETAVASFKVANKIGIKEEVKEEPIEPIKEVIK